MGDREIVETTDACAIPKWPGKKSLRYEVDDFIVSPPSNEDGGFFHLRFGRRTVPRPSTYDRINKELSMTVEIKDGDPLISGVELFGATEQAIASPTVAITPPELSPTVTPEVETDASKGCSTKPLFVFHLRDSKGSSDTQEPGISSDSSGASSPYGISDSLVTSRNQVTLEKSHTNISVSVEKKNELTPEDPNRERVKLTPEKYCHETEPTEQGPLANINLLERVQSLPVTAASSVEVTPYSTPLTTPLTSPNSRRKIYGVVMEQSSSHSYFCTKPFLGSQQTSESSEAFKSGSGGGGGVALSETSAQMTQQLESSARAAMALEQGQKLSKKRRPKPSTLREMNFWAPTSM